MLLFVLALIPRVLLGAPGELDPTFSFGGGTGVVRAVLPVPGVGIYIGGDFDSIGPAARDGVARLTSAGDVDPAFVPPVLGGGVFSIARQGDGKLIIVGSFQAGATNGIARLNPNGSLDGGFTPGSGADATVRAVALRSDGRVIVAGDFSTIAGQPRSRIALLNTDGTLHANFGPALNIAGVIRAVIVLPNDRVLISGNFSSVNGVSRKNIARLLSDGSLDASFNPGSGTDSWVSAMAVAANGKILIGGSFTTYDSVRRRRIARIEENGGLDPTFDPGAGANIAVSAIVGLPDGKILVGGGFDHVDIIGPPRLARFYANGMVDPFFSRGLGSTMWVEALAIQSDGRILAGGSPSPFNPGDRRLVQVEGGDPPDSAPSIIPPPTTTTRPEGSDVRLTVFANASPQPTYRWFRDGMEIPGATRETLELRNVRVADGGSYSVTVTNALGTASKLITVLVVTQLPPVPGGHDTGFYAGKGAFGIRDIASQADGKILIGGTFLEVDNVLSPGVARLHANGAFDDSFRASAEGIVQSVLPLPGGKTLIAGSFSGPGGMTSLAAQLNADGSYDPIFQTVEGSGMVFSMLRLPDQGTLIGGAFSIGGATPREALAKVEPNGAITPGFLVPIEGDKDVRAIASTPSGQVLIAGSFTAIAGVPRRNIARISPAGMLDLGFSAGLGPNGLVEHMLVQADGKIVIAGRFTRVNGIDRLRLARLNVDGSVDLTFDAGGITAEDLITGLALQADGRLIVSTETSYGLYAVGRHNPDGSLDASFQTVQVSGQPSRGPESDVTAIHLLADGSVLVAGGFEIENGVEGLSIARLFGGTAPFGAPVIVDPPDPVTVIAGGDASFTVVVRNAVPVTYQWRFNGVNLPGETRWYLTVRNARDAAEGMYSVSVQGPGGFAVSVPVALATVPPPHNAGAPDLDFFTGLGPNDRVDAVVIQPDGKIVIGGNFTTVNGVSRNRVARLLRNGSLDPSFNPGAGADGMVWALALDGNGNVIVGGDFETFDGVPRSRLARLKPDGGLDPAFNPSAGTDFAITATAVQADGRILIGGSFRNANGVARTGIARLDSGGNLDAAFNPALTGNPFVNAIVVQPDNSILIGGFFTYKTSGAHLARLREDGSFDPAFTVNGPNLVQALALEANNRILAAGLGAGVVLRLNANGNLNGVLASFAGGFVHTLAVQPNASVLLGGTFYAVAGYTRNKLARVTSAGGIDFTFDTGSGVLGGVPFINEYGELEQRTQVSRIVVESANSAIVAGDFNAINGASRPNIARIYLRNASLVDTDVDGLPDWWETQYGFDPASGAGVNGGNGDFDRDGSSNRREYITGNNPRKGTSFEPTITIGMLAPGVRVVRFPTARDRTYRIHFTNELLDPFVPVGPLIAGTGSEVTWVDDGSLTGGNTDARFYRLDVALAITE